MNGEPRIDLNLVRTPQRPKQSVSGDARRLRERRRRRDQRACETVVDRSSRKLLQNRELVGMIGKVQRSARGEPQSAPLQNISPDLDALQRKRSAAAGWLSNWPQGAEIPDRCARRAIVALEHGDTATAAHECVGERQSDNSGSDDRVVDRV